MTTEIDDTKKNDPLYADACEIVRSTGETNITHLQRAFKLGYNRAARLLEAMETDGIVSVTDKHGIRKLLKPE
jgi:DNA segregation ATPase FtsK/SpoIIIE-like protein